MKIAMIVERFPPDIGGSGVRFFQIAKRLSRRHRIDVLTLGKPGTQDSTFCFHVYRTSTGPEFMGHLKISRVAVHSLACPLRLLGQSYDVVDVDFWPIFPFFSVKLTRPRSPVIVTWNVAWPFSFYRPVSKIATRLARTVSELSTHNVTVSEFAKNSLSGNLGISRSRIEVIPNGVADEFLKAHVSPQWGRMIFVGRLEPQKRLDLILKAFHIASKQLDNLELHIIGSGSLYSQLSSASKQTTGLYIHGAISPSNTTELVSELRKSWVFVTASEFETHGIAMAESLAMGLPIILTQTPNNGAINDTVKAGHNSLIVKHNNPKAIAHAIQRLYSNEELWKRLSLNAKHKTALQSWDDISKKTEDAYARVCGESM
jgi:glycosyltransferase involved in cell wall biosynthesis